MLAVDESLGRIIDTLEDMGELDNTLIIFTSDNGYFYGEHGLTVERRLPYEESVRTPLLMRYPKLMETDPYELNNLVTDANMAPIVEDLKKDMRLGTLQ